MRRSSLVQATAQIDHKGRLILNKDLAKQFKNDFKDAKSAMEKGIPVVGKNIYNIY